MALHKPRQQTQSKNKTPYNTKLASCPEYCTHQPYRDRKNTFTEKPKSTKQKFKHKPRLKNRLIRLRKKETLAKFMIRKQKGPRRYYPRKSNWQPYKQIKYFQTKRRKPMVRVL